MDCLGAVGCCPFVRMMWDRRVAYRGARELHRYLLKREEGQECSTMSLLQMGADSLVHLSLLLLSQAWFLIYGPPSSASQTAEALIQLH